MNHSNSDSPAETVSVDVHIDRLCDRYEFLRKAGQAVTVAAFLRMEGIDPAAADSSLVRGLDALAVWYEPGNQPTVVLPADAIPDEIETLPEIRPGAVLGGRYELIDKIGEGGMGEVWRAQQTAPFRKLVAVKVIRQRPGQDARAILARFEAERQTLALMDHPNIARVRDAGTTDEGLPFFVMDLIKGVPITAFCDARRLSPKERLELFVPVCRAIQHAHQKGIIHRDIKPDNVLVALHDDRPVPVVIDFGIAKAFGQALTVESVATGHFAIVGTPEYMSPEQATLNQLDIDTRSDVYALGVLLYELLTGTTPVDRKSLGNAAWHEILRIVREVEAPRPSHRLSSSTMLADIATKRSAEPRRLGQQYHNELDWVLLKALEKDRTRRYESASDFAADIELHLNNGYVTARPPTRGYRLRKFYHRHRSQVIAAGLVLFALVCGVIGTTVGLVEARSQREKAEEALGKEFIQRGIADANLVEADKARRETTQQLWRAQLNEARATTRSGLVGQRFGSLATLRSALATAERVGMTAEDRKQFRDVATAALALPDVEEEKAWAGYPAGTHHHVIDGKFERYARTDPEGNASVRRVSDDVELYSFPLGGVPKAVSLSPSGRILVVSDNAGPEDKRVGRVYRLNGPEPERLTELTVLFGPNVFVTPDDERVVFSTRTSVGVWEVNTGEKREWPLPGPQHGHASLSRDGRRVAYSSSQGMSLIVRVLEVETGRVVADLPLSGTTDALAFHPNGKIVAVASQKKIHIWDVEAKRLLRTMEGHTNGGVIPAFDSTGERLVSNDWSSILRVWDWRAGRQVLATSPVSGPFAATLSADDRLLTLAPGTDKLKVLRLHAGLERRSFAAPLAPIKWMHTDPGGRFAVVTQLKPFEEGRPIVVDPATGDELARLPVVGAGQRAFHVATDGAVLTNGHSGINRWPLTTTPDAGLLLFGPMHTVRAGYTTDTHHASADGRVVAVPAYSAGAYVFHADRPQTPVTCGPQHDVRNVAVSPDGRLVVTGTHGGTTGSGWKVWNARTGELVKEFADDAAFGTFSPDGRWLVNGNRVRVRRTDDWSDHPHIPESDVSVQCMFSPDSRLLALGGQSMVRLLRMTDGTELVRLPYTEQSAIIPLCFSPDGATLFALNNDTAEVAAWDLRRLRAGLAELRLDWDEPPLPPAPAPRPPPRVEFAGAATEKIPPAPPPLPSVTDFREAHGLDVAGLKKWVAGLPPGFHPTDIAARAGGIVPRFDALAVRDGTAPPFLVTTALPQINDKYMDDFRARASSGWRLRTVATYQDGDTFRRHHLWVQDGRNWAGYGHRKADLPAAAAQWRKDSRRPVSFHATYTVPTDPLLGVVLGPNDGAEWELVYGLTTAELLAQATVARNRGWRIDALNGFGTGTDRTYTVSLIANRLREPWELKVDLTPEEYEAAVADGRTRGLRPLAVTSADDGKQVRFAAVFVPFAPPRELAPLPSPAK